MAKRKQIQPRVGVERAFGDEMRKARSRSKMSQMDLYKATGLDRTFISDLERGIQGPSLTTVFRVARGVGMQPEILIEKTRNSHFFVFPTDERPQTKAKKS
jgi:transcriptional regulator with XRE-family HTH domain